MVFFLILIIAICLLIPFIYYGYSYRQKALSEMPVGYNFPMLQDFILTAKSAIFFVGIDFICRYYLYKLMIPFCKEQDDLVMRDIRCVKCVVHMYKAFYFLVATLWGYSV